MKYEPIPVTPAIITWARERAGYSLDEAKTKFSEIEDWEKGETLPSYPALERMSDEFKIPVAVFFFPNPPDVPPISESFRTLPKYEIEQLPQRIHLLLRKAKAFQLSLIELIGDKNPAQRFILRDLVIDTTVPVGDLTSRVREYLGISFEEQTSWLSVATALENWRNTLQNVGIFVFKDAFKAEGYSGFCLYDEEFPLIYVNNSSAKTRQIFTLFHELAHLLFHTSGIDTLNDDFIDRLPDHDQKIEAACNHFAAEFLLPDEIFEAAFSNLEPSEETAAELASRFHVSREFIFRKFLDQNLITQQAYNDCADKWAKQKKGGGGGNYYSTVLSYLGRDYVNLVFGQYYQNRINETQLADYLNIKPKNLGSLENHIFRGGG